MTDTQRMNDGIAQWYADEADTEYDDNSNEGVQIEGANVRRGRESIFTVDCGDYHGLSNEMAKRIALCLNACEGLPDSYLQGKKHLFSRRTAYLEAQLAKAREALDYITKSAYAIDMARVAQQALKDTE